MASNATGLADEDGENSDWIEIYNPTSSTINLAGWSLSDDPKNVAKWQFPAVSILPKGFTLVFASGKDRAIAGRQLHTNFKLDLDGESIILSNPAGEVVSSILNYPPQLANVSYGVSIVTESDILVPTNSPARIFIPTTSGPGATWTQPAFNDSSWQLATMGIGYDRIPVGQVDTNEPPAVAADITEPGDEIIPTSSNSPPGEGVTLAIDNSTATKYLNFDKLNAGFTVTPANAQNVVKGLRITSANDAPERDPTSYILSGWNGAAFIEIARGSIPTFPNRFSPVQVTFANNTAYQKYKLIFPTVQNANAAVAMQISEVEFLGQSLDPAPSLSPFLQTNLEASLFGKATSAYARLPFNVPAGQVLDNPNLRLRYDDGFAAWLNGTLIAQANAPAGMAFNGIAPTNRFRAQAAQEARINIGQFANLLNEGANILAIQVWNDRAASPDLLAQAQLEIQRFIIGDAGYFAQPTPNADNSVASPGVVGEVVLGQPRGYFDAPFDLTLRTGTEGAIIRYTTNGSPPTASSGTVYAGPIRIDRTTIFRAAAFRDDWLPSRVASATYLFLDDIVKQTQAAALASGLPTSWGGFPAEYGLDPRIVGPSDSYSGKYARTIKADLRSLPAVSIVMDRDDMFGSNGLYPNSVAHGEVWERGLSIELIETNGFSGFQADAGIRIQGGAFRRFDLTMKKSFRVVFREEYGPTRLDYPLFGKDAAGDFNNFVLRANGNDAYPYGGANSLYMRDAFAMETVREMGSVSSHTRFVHLFINGLYWGMYNLVERPDAAFSASYYGGDRSTWDAINQDSAPDGSFDAWNRLLAALNSDMSKTENYQRIQGNNPDGTRNPAYENLIDVDSMINYMIMNLYIGNADWPGRNWWTGRDRNNGDGFKFYPWDSETALGFTGVNHNVTDVNSAVARPYGALRANADFRLRFADHVYRHFYNGGAFYVNPASPAWDPARPENNRPAARVFNISESIRGGMVGETARWGDTKGGGPYTRDEHWLATRNGLLANYLPQRSAIVMNQFRNAGLYPLTEAPVMNVHGGQVAPGFQLVMNSSQGSIFYTTNGTDPRSPITLLEQTRAIVAATNLAKKVFIPTVANGGSLLEAQWQGGQEPFDDSRWTDGSGGIGFDQLPDYRPFIQTDVLSAMLGVNASAFIRIRFNYDGTGQNTANYMMLRAQYDDGFVAFLNGVKIAAANAPATLSWNSAAVNSHADTEAVKFIEVRADAGLPALKIGENILAIQAMNFAISGNDFLFNAELVMGELGGSSSTKAIRYTGPVTLTDATTIKARVINGQEWSALNEAHFIVGEPKLVLNELHYHPHRTSAEERAAGFTDNEAFEFVELWNNGTASYDLSGVQFTRGIQFDFANAGTNRLGPDQYLVLIKNRAAFERRYGTNVPIAGIYTGSLDNSGERLQLVDNAQTLFDFRYGTASPWPNSPDGDGPSLEPINPSLSLANAANWRASSIRGGSPGRKNPAPSVAITNLAVTGAQIHFAFAIRAGQGAVVYQADTIDAATWTAVRVIDPAPSETVVNIELPLGENTGGRFYRVSVTP